MPAERWLPLRHLHTGEELEAVYVVDGRYRPAALEEVAHLLRDWRTGATRPVQPNLLDLLWAVRDRLGATGPIEVTCGYRTPATNELLRQEHYPASRASLHMRGMAVDMRLPDRAPAAVRDVALALGLGGVGYYPRQGFVHLDTGPMRRW